MVKCPVCNRFSMDKSNIEFEMFFNGSLVQVCGACYHEAFIKTNLKRMLHARNKKFMKIEGGGG